MKKNELVSYILVSVTKIYFETLNKEEFSKKLPIEEGLCNIEIGLNFNLFIIEQNFSSVKLFFTNLPLEVAEVFTLKNNEEKTFEYNFDNFSFRCTIKSVL